MVKKLSSQERLELLFKNHFEHFNSIITNFVNQAHQLMSLIEEEEKLTTVKRTVDKLGIPYKNQEVKK